MAATGIMRNCELERGEPMEVIMPKLLEQYDHKIHLVALALYPGIYDGTVRYWLTSHDYVREAENGKWRKKSECIRDENDNWLWRPDETTENAA